MLTFYKNGNITIPALPVLMVFETSIRTPAPYPLNSAFVFVIILYVSGVFHDERELGKLA
jgi:hypothetical protein